MARRDLRPTQHGTVSQPPSATRGNARGRRGRRPMKDPSGTGRNHNWAPAASGGLPSAPPRDRLSGQ
jgi:hypothetical protein